jgi:hypothetical protein
MKTLVKNNLMNKIMMFCHRNLFISILFIAILFVPINSFLHDKFNLKFIEVYIPYFIIFNTLIRESRERGENHDKIMDFTSGLLNEKNEQIAISSYKENELLFKKYKETDKTEQIESMYKELMETILSSNLESKQINDLYYDFVQVVCEKSKAEKEDFINKQVEKLLLGVKNVQ